MVYGIFYHVTIESCTSPDESVKRKQHAREARGSMRVLRIRIKDKHKGFLNECARQVNTVFNFCNDLGLKVLEREGRWMTGFDYWPYLKGATRDDATDGAPLILPVQTVQEVAEEQARRRRQHKRRRLAWRKSRGARRSLGWVPFKVKTLELRHGQIRFAGRWLSLFDSFNLGGLAKDAMPLRAGSFSEDARGRWFLNVAVETPTASGYVGPRQARSEPVGIDLGLKSLAAFSDGRPTVPADRFYRDLEPALATAQRAGKMARVRAIHAKVANRRKDALHKLSTSLAQSSQAIFVGNVNAAALAKTSMAKSVLDAGWSTFRTMLQYKCDDAGAWFAEVNEAFSTLTCNACGARTGPFGPDALGVRSWRCACGVEHDRDVNAARNILLTGLALMEQEQGKPAQGLAGKATCRSVALVSNEVAA
jgi:putative transposase